MAKYSPEFKEQLVREVIDNSRTVAEVARENNVGAETLRLWVVKYRKTHGLSGSAGSPHRRGATESSENEELERLRKENRELRMEREFLKKAAAFFAREQR